MERALTLLLALALGAPVHAQQPRSAQQGTRTETSTQTVSGQAGTTLTPSQVFSRARPSVVVIVAADQNGQREALGSGFIVGHGRIATNHHVVEGMSEAYVVFSDGDVKPVSKVVADSGPQDLIILGAETGKRLPLVFGDELSLQQGDPVYALGAPKGLELTFTNGIVSAFRKSDAQFLIQTTAPIAPGSSGGPLFDRTGRAVGVTTSLLADAPGIYFSVGIGDVKRLLRTAEGVALPFGEWSKQQATERSSESPSVVASNDAPRSPTMTPSLEETLSWMDSFLQAHGQEWTGSSVPSQSNSEHLPSQLLGAFREFAKEPWAPNRGCAVFIQHSYAAGVQLHMDMKAPAKTSEEFILLTDIDPATLKLSGSHVSFETTGSLDQIVEWVPATDDGEKFSEYDLDGGYMVLDSPENAQRFATAFKHAVTLCGGTKAPF
jgi:hypothetical protein